MKLIIAYIQPETLNDVKQALLKENIAKLSVVNALGCGPEVNVKWETKWEGRDS